MNDKTKLLLNKMHTDPKRPVVKVARSSGWGGGGGGGGPGERTEASRGREIGTF